MTLECGTTIFPASHAGKFRDISGVFRPNEVILLQQEKTKLLSTSSRTMAMMSESQRAQQFHAIGNDPQAWRMSADELLATARVLKRQREAVSRGGTDLVT